MNNNKSKHPNYIKALKQTQFQTSFKHIIKMQESNDLALIDIETGNRRTYAVIGKIKIQKNKFN